MQEKLEKSLSFLFVISSSQVLKQGPSYLLMHVPLKYFFETLVNTSYPSFCYRVLLDKGTLGVLRLILFTQQFLHYLDFLMI